jgi:Protein of unknown function (DUF3592)
VGLPLVLFSILLLQQCLRHEQISKRQRTTFGTVNTHEPANHNRYGYIFLVAGKQYSGWGHPSEPRIGQPVTVYYDSQDPSENALSSYDNFCVEFAVPIGVPIVILVYMAAFIAWRRRKYSRVPINEQ